MIGREEEARHMQKWQSVHGSVNSLGQAHVMQQAVFLRESEIFSWQLTGRCNIRIQTPSRLETASTTLFETLFQQALVL